MNYKQVFEAVIVLVAVVLVWRGTWGLLDLYFMPNDPTSSLVISLGLGVLTLIVFGKKIIKLL